MAIIVNSDKQGSYNRPGTYRTVYQNGKQRYIGLQRTYAPHIDKVSAISSARTERNESSILILGVLFIIGLITLAAASTM